MRLGRRLVEQLLRARPLLGQGALQRPRLALVRGARAQEAALALGEGGPLVAQVALSLGEELLRAGELLVPGLERRAQLGQRRLEVAADLGELPGRAGGLLGRGLDGGELAPDLGRLRLGGVEALAQPSARPGSSSRAPAARLSPRPPGAPG
ncbi:MAG: hypothetical protein M9894_28650 [Planctomycetes bacterium]|nr:hypothetical protein [Planctomycetota bacterium]